MVKITETDNKIIVAFDYDEHMIKVAKSVFPARYSKVTRTWHWNILLREEVYRAFQQECPPRALKSNFAIESEPSPFLMKHQRDSLMLAQRFPKYGFYHETGTGKSITSLEILRHKAVKAIVVAPLSILESVWVETINTFYPYFKKINLYPYNKVNREKIALTQGGIHIINFEGFKIQFDVFMKAGYRCLIVDESSKLRGKTTDIAKKLIAFGNKVESAYLLSGNPAPNSKDEFFPQVELIAPGLLGYNYYAFRNRYFYSVDKNGFEWIENEATKDEFIERLRRVCIFIKKHDVLDLPERTFEVREVNMDSEQKRYYQEMKKEFMTQIATVEIISPTVLSKIMKLRQITSGFVYHADSSIRFSHAKSDALLETLQEIGNTQVIIWGIFQEEIRMLLKLIPGSRAVYGATKTQKERDENIKDFIDGKYQYLLSNPSSLGLGQNFINASFEVFYSLDYSSDAYMQACDRIYRKGQKNFCTYIHLLCRNSIDEIIYRMLHRKIDVSKEILEHLKK